MQVLFWLAANCNLRSQNTKNGYLVKQEGLRGANNMLSGWKHGAEAWLSGTRSLSK